MYNLLFQYVSPTGSTPSMQHLTHNKALKEDLIQALQYTDDADRRYWHALNNDTSKQTPTHNMQSSSVELPVYSYEGDN